MLIHVGLWQFIRNHRDVPGQSATISLDLTVADLLELAQAIDLIRRIPNVRDVRRI